MLLIGGVVRAESKMDFGPRDSVLVHIVNARQGKDENGKLEVNLRWILLVKRYDAKRKTYDGWEPVEKREGKFVFEPEVATDSLFENVVARARTDKFDYVFKGLDFGTHYWWRVKLVSPQVQGRWDFAEGVIWHRNHSAFAEQENNRSEVQDAVKFFKIAAEVIVLEITLVLLLVIVVLSLLAKNLWSRRKTT